MSTNREEARKLKTQEERLRQESRMVETVIAALQRKLDSIRVSRGASSLKLENAEKEVLLKLNNSGLVPGTVAGVVSFVLLRRMRRFVLQRRVQQQQSNPSFPHPPSSTPGNTTAAPHVHNSPLSSSQSSSFQPPTGPPSSSLLLASGEEPLLLKVLGLLLDGTVSFAIAVMASVQFTDMKMILHEFSRIPLLPGHSVVAEEFCPVVLEELQKLDQEQMNTSQEDWKQHVQSVYMKAIVDFGKHCQQRRAYELRLQKEQGIDNEDDDMNRTKPFHMSIPSPGVPEMDWDSDNMISNKMNDHPNNDDNNNNMDWMVDDTQWADDLTRDQGEDK